MTEERLQFIDQEAPIGFSSWGDWFGQLLHKGTVSYYSNSISIAEYLSICASFVSTPTRTTLVQMCGKQYVENDHLRMTVFFLQTFHHFNASVMMTAVAGNATVDNELLVLAHYVVHEDFRPIEEADDLSAALENFSKALGFTHYAWISSLL